MRTVLTITAAALALGACGPKAGTDNATAINDTMTVPMNEDGNASSGTVINEGPTNGTAMGEGGAATMTVDTASDFVSKAAMSDMYEIASSKLAATRASSPGVKKFATDMIAAHTATTAALKAAKAKDNVIAMPPVKLDAEHQALIDALTAAKGAEFDSAYIAQQTNAHTETLAMMQSFATSGDQPALKAFAGDTAPKVKMHLGMVQTLR